MSVVQTLILGARIFFLNEQWGQIYLFSFVFLGFWLSDIPSRLPSAVGAGSSPQLLASTVPGI